MRLFLLALAAAAAMVASSALAENVPQTPEEKAELEQLATLLESLTPIRGVVELEQADARLDLGDRYYFLGPDDARRVIVEGWNNPPSSAEGVLGLVFPEGVTFLDFEGWGAVISYEQTHYVSDEDAASADYDALMRDMQAEDDAVNAAREEAGFEPVRLVGWAQPPAYDATRHDLIWAREIQFGAEEDHTLNYDVRHLGRRGVLSMNIVGAMSQLQEIAVSAPDLAQTAEFNQGARYADYEQGDQRAGYGLAGLVATGAGLAVAKKAGLFAAAALFLKKGWVLIFAAGAAVFAWVRKRFFRGSSE